jgi:ornithine cyclodeaminase
MTNGVPAIIDLPSIQEYLKTIDSIPLIEEGFVAYSSRKAVIPPIGELLFENPPGEVHIKYGYLKETPYYVIKIASGFYKNPKLGLRSSQGLMMLFSQRTGELLAILLDDGHLTDIRTTIASMITLKYLAPENVIAIGIIGTGTQARLQLEFLHQVSDCKNIIIWGRNKSSCLAFQKEFQNSSFNIRVADSISSLAQSCSVIITTTPSTIPLLQYEDLSPGTHITAIGSDTSEKIELSPLIIKNADLVISDSISQSQSRGEVYQARKHGTLNENKLIELGTLIQNPSQGRVNDKQLTVADLTGVAVQDIMIATAIFNHHKNLEL